MGEMAELFAESASGNSKENEIDEGSSLRVVYNGQESDYGLYVAENLRQSEKIGGVGITKRSLSDIQEFIPDVAEKIAKLDSQDKVVFVGNGLSQAPLDFIRKLEEGGRDIPQVVVHDLFDYPSALDYLEAEQRRITEEYGKPSHMLQDDIERCRDIVSAARAGSVRLVTHTFGSKRQLPEELTNSDLTINVYGPPRETLDEQLKMLSKKGIHIQDTSSIKYNKMRFALDHDNRTGFGEIRRRSFGGRIRDFIS